MIVVFGVMYFGVDYVVVDIVMFDYGVVVGGFDEVWLV